MYRAIIVDDEQKICSLIQMLGDWERLSIEICGVFYDGEDALEYILSNAPDIVITDIKMPVYDGLELIEKTREAGIDSSFVIISGYRHFEYAYRSMQFGIVDYLLKPIDRDDLNHTLEKICQNLKNRRIEEHEKADYRSLLQEKALHRHQLLLDDLEKGCVKGDSLEAFNDYYQTDFAPGRFRVLLLHTSLPQLHLSSSSFLSHAAEIAQDVFSGPCKTLTLQNHYGIFCLLSYPESSSVLVPDNISRFFNRLRSLSDIYGNFSLVIGSGDEAKSCLDLPRSFEKAVIYARSKLFVGWEKVISFLPRPLKERPEPLLAERQLKQLKDALDLHSVSAVSQWFANWRDGLAPDQLIDPRPLYQARDEILSLVAGLFSLEDELDDIFMWSDCARNVFDFINKLSAFAVSALEKRLAAIAEEETLPIRKAKEYIRRNYALPISLEEVAEKADYNPAYFSSLFKKHTGQNFSDYLTEVRIEQAKELLKSTRDSVTDIAERVGYTDSKYFRKLFKKVTGIRPNDYRKLY